MSRETVLLAVVAPTDDVSLQCTTSLLKFQQHMATKAVSMDFHIVKSVREALNLFPRCTWLVVIDGQCGFSSTFISDALESGHGAIYGVYPLPTVNWPRVQERLQSGDGEPIGHAGNVYNLVPKSASLAQYVPVQSVTDSKVMILRSDIIDTITGPHTSCEDGHVVWYDSSYQNQYHTPAQTFFRLLSQHTTVMADIREQCTVSGNAQFSGCVGQRGFLRK